MKQRWIMICCLLTLALLPLAAGDLAFSLGFSWELGLRVGVEYFFLPELAVKADIGTSVFSLEGDFALMYDLLLAYYPFQWQSPWTLGVAAGLTSGMSVFSEPPASMHALGLTLLPGYRFSDQFQLRLRCGLGYPLFIEEDRKEWGDVDSFLNCWPDLGLEGIFLF